MTVDWSLCRYPACIEECRDGPKIDCPAVLAWREKKDDTMTDISKEAVERATDEAGRQSCKAAMEANLSPFPCHETCPCSLELMVIAQAARIAELEAAMQYAWDEVTLEINPSNYGHDDVCLLNDQVTTALMHLEPFIAKDTSHDG